jgi:hypothetical protein
MVVKIFNKYFILGIITLILSQPVLAANNWKHIENNKTNKVSTYLQTNSINKSGDFVTYTTRLKMKNVGDYINVVYTNCTDFSSATLGTYEFNKDFSISYEDLYSNIPSELTPLDNTAILYNVASVACVSNQTYKVIKGKKENMFVKVVKGVGTVIGFILLAPFVIVAAVFSAL